MTQEFLQDALVEDLKQLFRDYTLKNSAGGALPVRVYAQDLPLRAGDDEVEAETAEDAPEPYILVRLRGGEQPAQDARLRAEVILVICVWDPAPDRQGFRDTLHIVNTILHHYGTCGVVARRYEVQYPIQWTSQEEDTHPYYFAAMALTFDAPAIFKEVPET